MNNIIKTISNPEIFLDLADYFIRLSEYEHKFDHPLLALDAYITAKTLVRWAKVIVEGVKTNG